MRKRESSSFTAQTPTDSSGVLLLARWAAAKMGRLVNRETAARMGGHFFSFFLGGLKTKPFIKKAPLPFHRVTAKLVSRLSETAGGPAAGTGVRDDVWTSLPSRYKK